MSKMRSNPRLAVIILNWKNAEVTLNCFNSVANMDYPNFDIYVCDNDSKDGSMETLVHSISMQLPSVNKMRTDRHLHTFQFSADKNTTEHTEASETKGHHHAIRRVTVLETGRNGGYAYGNNVGLQAAIQALDTEFFWILNNDTTVDTLAARRLIETMQADESIGICGSTVLYMNQPDVVQTLGGGKFLPWKARCEQLGTGMLLTEILPVADVEKSLDYINGASALVRRRFIETVGFMDESYFLYYEEVDWAVRGRAAGFRLSYCSNSFVYHQVGASSGTADDGSSSMSSVFYAERSKFKFLMKHYPSFLTIAIPLLCSEYVKRVIHGRQASANAMLHGAYKAFLN